MGRLEEGARLHEKRKALLEAIKEVEASPPEIPNRAAKLYELREELAMVDQELRRIFSAS